MAALPRLPRMQQHQTHQAQEASQARGEGTSVAEAKHAFEAVLRSGEKSFDNTVAFLRSFPQYRAALFTMLHERMGNHVAQQVASKLDAKDELAKLTADQRSYHDAAATADPTHAKDAMRYAAMSRPLSKEDQNAVEAAQQKIAAMKPKVIDDGRNPHLVQIELAFDGSGNSRDQDAFDTGPALIDNMFQGHKHYERGVATDPSTAIIGMYTGAGLRNRINDAYDNLVTQVNQIKGSKPNAEVVLVVTGFSRGSTAARAFTNELNRRGMPVLSSKLPDGSYGKHYATPRVGVMVLFDTVQMTVNRSFDLSIPANVDNVLHLTARDEKRSTYPLTSAKDPARPDDARINEVALPGAHADIGGGYPNRYSQLPAQMARQYMRNAGVHLAPEDPKTQVHASDPDLRLHDSGSPLFGDSRTVFSSTNPR